MPLSMFHAFKIAQRRYEVERDTSATDAQVFGMEVALVAAIVVAAHTGLQPFVNLHTAGHNQRAALLH